jgi:aminoglycoside phosphotransferase family enzyme
MVSERVQIDRSMQDIALMVVEEYIEFMEGYDPTFLGSDVYVTVQAYIRARVMSELEYAIDYAMSYAETNGGGICVCYVQGGGCFAISG